MEDQQPIEPIVKRGRGRPRLVLTPEQMEERRLLRQTQGAARFKKYYDLNREKLNEMQRLNYRRRQGFEHGYALVPLDENNQLSLDRAIYK